MPGIVGLISDRAEEPLFSSMKDSLNHRNYAVDSFIKNGVHLSRVHLNYINTTPQPLHSADGHYSSVFHGEIFSVEDQPQTEIKDSGRMFLDLIAKHGMSILNKLNGQFSACVVDNNSNTTYLISDRFGTRPLHYAVHNKRLLFAPEVKAILKDSIKRELDYHAIAELFSFGHLFGTKTIFKNVYVVPPGTVVKYHQGIVEKMEYWSPSYKEEVYTNRKLNKKQSDELQDSLGQILITAIKRQSSNADNLLIPLSGGLDSRYVAALYHQIGQRNVQTYTMGPEESEDQRYASQVAAQLGFQHFKLKIVPEKTWDVAGTFSYIADGMSSINTTLQNFQPFEHFAGKKQIISASQMCDALFGSTLARKRIRILKQNTEPRHITNELIINIFRLFDQNQIKQLFHPDAYKKIEGLYRIEPEKYCSDDRHPLYNYFLLLLTEHGRRGTFGGNVGANLFFEMRMPSYDNDVFNFGWDLPVIYKEHQYLYRMTFSRLFPELAKIKRQGYSLKINASNSRYELKLAESKIATLALNSPLRHVVKYYRPWIKPSYTNYNHWFQHELKDTLISFLMKDDLKCQALLNINYIKTLVSEHVEGKRDHAALLWQIINLEHIFRNFIE